jgi:hypothetical protein
LDASAVSSIAAIATLENEISIARLVRDPDLKIATDRSEAWWRSLVQHQKSSAVIRFHGAR